MATLHLTDITIRSLKEGNFYDDKTPGFGIRVGKHRMTWIAVIGKSRTKVKLGYYPTLSLADDRKKALVALGSPYEPSTAPSFEDARDEYLGQGQWSERERYETNRLLKKHFHWSKTIDKISHKDVQDAVRAIKAKSEAHHAYNDIRTFFNWCVPTYLKSSPCAGLQSPHSYIPRRRVLNDAERKKVLLAANSLEYEPYKALIWLLALCGQRLTESSHFTEYKFENGCITIPADGTKNGHEHTVPIPNMAAAFISKVRPSTNWQRYKPKLDKLCGVTNCTHHDLRRTYATVMRRLGVPLEVTEQLLNHVSGTRSGIVGIYQNYKYQAEMREAVDKYEGFIKQLLASEPTRNVATAPQRGDASSEIIGHERSVSADTLVACL
ncbi:integrase [Bradyrhizobium sp. USDA 4461]